jgi:hypothetical protein
MKVNIYTQHGGNGLSALAAAEAMGLTADGQVVPADNSAIDLPVLMPAAVHVSGVAVLIVTEALAGHLAHNGCPLPAGAHVIHDRDALTWGGMTVWVARQEVAVEEPYDPSRHRGEPACARTRAPIKPGEPIIACPGADCTAIYKPTAWLGLRCVACGFEPGKQAWEPPLKGKGRLHEMLRLSSPAR